jgi:hypothetical protein
MINRIKSLIQYTSDLHLEKGFKRNIIASKPYLILVGDIGYPNNDSYKDFLLNISSKFDKVFVVAGNHEYDQNKNVLEVNNKIENICNMRNNLFFLQQKTHKICETNNIKIAGCTLWSAFPKIKHRYHLEDKCWLYNTINENKESYFVVATHHCPLYECINNKYNKDNKYNRMSYFASDQSHILKKNNLLMWIHGHSHYNRNLNIYNTEIVSNQYGSYKNPLYGYKYN